MVENSGIGLDQLVGGTLHHRGGIHAGLGVFAVHIESPVGLLGVPISGDAIDGIDVQTVITDLSLDQLQSKQGLANGFGIGMDLKAGGGAVQIKKVAAPSPMGV